MDLTCNPAPELSIHAAIAAVITAISSGLNPSKDELGSHLLWNEQKYLFPLSLSLFLLMFIIPIINHCDYCGVDFYTYNNQN